MTNKSQLQEHIESIRQHADSCPACAKYLRCRRIDAYVVGLGSLFEETMFDWIIWHREHKKDLRIFLHKIQRIIQILDK